eukprot:CAMPEP_0184707606 /NCGR_PEP_ID=MMETSP0313-20130426/37353_1 /TAXON_ID=2792 /ORGANISM="Porphyridium aerugineum, Strain SAG 1380-2" /LENGTH=462 /DNA_ID=CAMNT_0027169185 /DNA_START=787 /DNA_END=2175 /DNA_ORIENTATION=+
MEQQHRENRTALNKQMNQAIERGDVALVKDCLKRGGRALSRDAEGISPIIRAVSHGRLEVARLLILNGADVDDKLPENGNSLLHIAAERGDLAVLNLLIESKAGLEVKNDRGDTPLKLAAILGHIDIVQRLLDAHVNIEARDYKGQNSLMGSSARGKLSSVKVLLEHGAKINAIDNFQCNSLMKAAFWGRRAIVKYLLESGADRNAVDMQGRTAIDYAREKNHDEIIDIITNFSASRTVNMNMGLQDGTVHSQAPKVNPWTMHPEMDPAIAVNGNHGSNHHGGTGSGGGGGGVGGGAAASSAAAGVATSPDGVTGVAGTTGAAGASAAGVLDFAEYDATKSVTDLVLETDGTYDNDVYRNNGNHNSMADASGHSPLLDPTVTANPTVVAEKKRWYKEFLETLAAFDCEELGIDEASFLASSLCNKQLSTCRLVLLQSDKNRTGTINRIKFMIAMNSLAAGTH